MRTLATPRFLLRPLAAGDESLYCRLYGDAGAMRWIAAPQPGADAARSFQAALRQDQAVPARRRFWVIHEATTRRDLGLIGLDLDGSRGGEVGVVLPEDCQGQGIATEAIAALAGHAFADMGLVRLHTRHASGHGLAAGLMARLGFTRTASAHGDAGWRWELGAEQWRHRGGDKAGSIR